MQDDVEDDVEDEPHHSHHVEQRHQHRGKGKHHVVVARYPRADIHRAQVNHQEAEDIAQREASRVAHKELSSPHGIAEHVVIPERNNHSDGRDAEQGVGIHVKPDMQTDERHQRDGAKPGSQTADAIYQVDGVRHIHHDEHRERTGLPDEG